MKTHVRNKLRQAYDAIVRDITESPSPALGEVGGQYKFIKAANELRDEIARLRLVAGINRDVLLVDLDHFLQQLVPARSGDATQIEGFRKRIAAELVE